VLAISAAVTPKSSGLFAPGPARCPLPVTAGRVGCPSCLQAGLVARQGGFLAWQEQEGSPQPGLSGTGQCEAGSKAWSPPGTPGEPHGRALPLRPRRAAAGHSALVPASAAQRRAWGHSGGSHRSPQGHRAIPAPRHPARQERAPTGLCCARRPRRGWCQRGAPSSAGPCLPHRTSGKGPSRGLSVAQILSWHGAGAPSW